MQRSSQVTARVEDSIAWLVLDNPKRRNAMTLEMQAAIPALLLQLENDEAVRVLVVRGAGEEAFVAGADISEFERERDTPEAIARYGAVTHAAFAALSAWPKPTLSMIHGPCIGGGLALARETVSHLLGIPIDYVVYIDFEGFIGAIDALGGVTVDVVPAYETRPAGNEHKQRLQALIADNEVDVILFTSSSTVDSMVEMLGADAASMLSRVTLASIGPITSATAARRGLEVAVTAETYTVEGLLDALEKHYATELT